MKTQPALPPEVIAERAAALGLSEAQVKSLLSCGHNTPNERAARLDQRNHHIVWVDGKPKLRVRIAHRVKLFSLPEDLDAARAERDRLLIQLGYKGQDFRRELRQKGVSL
jgi:hypothetical protein